MRSTRPYCIASSADRKLSRSVSLAMRSIDWPGVLRHDLVQLGPEIQDLLGVDLDVGGLALKAAHRLVDHHPRVRQAVALALCPGGKQQRAHARRLPDAQRGHVRLHELHRVVDREARRHRAARRVDIERDVLIRVFRLEEEQLRDDQVGRHLVDRSDEEDDPLLEQPRVDVVGALAAPALLDHHRDQPQPLRLRSFTASVPAHSHAACPISSSNATGLSTTRACLRTQSITFSSTARPSNSASRSG